MKIFELSKLLLPPLLLIAATSCKKSEIAPITQEMPLSTNLREFSSNAAISYNNQIDLDLPASGLFEFNSCTGESLRIVSGVWHFVFHGMSSNHAFLMSIHNNTQNYKLVGMETGIEYNGSSTWDGHYSFPTSNPNSFTLTIVNSVTLTTPGGDNNSRLKADLHITVNPNGSMTVNIDNLRAGCQ